MSSEQTNHSSTEPTKEGVVSHASIVPVADVLPPSVVLLPVSQTSIFPGMIVPVVLPEGALTNAIENVMKGSGYVGVVLAREDAAAEAASPPTTMTGLPMEPAAEERGKKKPKPKADPLEDALYWEYGVVAKVLKRINLPDNQVSILLNGVQRFRIKAIVSREPHVVANVDYLPDEVTKDTELEALLRTAVSQFKQLAKDNPLISEEVKVALVNIDGPGKLTDLMASVLVRDVDSYQDLLACNDVKERLQQLLLLLRKEQAVQNVQKQIHDEINQKVSAAQREFYLSEQLKVIQRELGHTDEKTKLVEKFEKRLKDLKPNKEVRARIDEEIEKIQNLHEQSSEYSVSLNYLDWATQIPWGVRTDENYDLGRARKILERDHFGLKDVKERVLEFLAVKKLKKSSEGSIICFVGPPGTGKTSLGKSIATALGRKFFRFSVGGMRDEAEIKGHRRTYVGAMPGKVIQGVRRVGAQNPVFMIDEVDKIGSSFSTGGDPASALLELLDPEQNKEFLDHYLDIPFDCSEILFVTTANTIDTIPPALLDRMEVIELHGYSDTEKYHIAKRHLIPRQLKKNALKASQLKFSAAGLRFLISHYARESGVRN
ncbi:MAG: endopeptidase La, partial [Bdellovibrionales bacterium]|nr:endopeptidase La [Bdellovibrionales bacterium]